MQSQKGNLLHRRLILLCIKKTISKGMVSPGGIVKVGVVEAKI
jgi:hypothetical protein